MGAIEGKQKMAHMQATGAMVLNLDLRVHSLIVKDPVPKQKAYNYIMINILIHFNGQMGSLARVGAKI